MQGQQYLDEASRKRLLSLVTVILVFASIVTLALLPIFKPSLEEYPNVLRAENALFSLFHSTTQYVNAQPTEETIDSIIVELQPDKTDYQLGDKIGLSGRVMNGTTPLTNFPIFIALNDSSGSVLAKTKLLTGSSDGAFSYTTPSIQTEGMVTITAFTDENSNIPDELITVMVNDFLGYGILVAITALIIVAFFLLYLGYIKDKLFLTIASAFADAIGFALYVAYPPTTDPFGQFTIAGALLAPLAGVVIDFIRKNQEARQELKGSITDYRDENLKTELQMLINVYNELVQHLTVFESEIDTFTADTQLINKLSDKVRIGTMANFPGKRVGQYYRYVDDFNKLLTAYVNRSGILNKDTPRNNFKQIFNEVKSAYRELETVLYVNIIYSIGEVRQRFFSFEKHQYPFRYSWPLLFRLLKIEALGPIDRRQLLGYENGKAIIEYKLKDGPEIWYSERVDKSKELVKWIQDNKIDIYSEMRPYMLMSLLEEEFGNYYKQIGRGMQRIRSEFDILEAAPVAYPQALITTKNSSKAIQLAGSNSPNRKLTYKIKSHPRLGKLSPDASSDGKFSYEPANNLVYDDSFSFIVNDGYSDSEPATVSIVVKNS